jgi:hypothetical protein
LALSEFKAMETAYLALQELDPAARGRALHWLSDALGGGTKMLPHVPDDDGAASAEPAIVPARPSRSRAAKAAGPPKGGAGRRGPTATAKRSTGGQVRSSRARIPEPAPGERAYRRMPAADEVLSAYQQVGTVRGLADYYGVPRHTVQGWARRLRREGYSIGQGA